MSDQAIKRVLVLSGGGGRGAYQVGVCKYLLDFPRNGPKWRPDMILGNSIGSTNGAILAAPRGLHPTDADPFKHGVERLADLWLKQMSNKNLHQVSDEWPRVLGLIMCLVIRVLQAFQEPPKHAEVDALLSELIQSATASMPEEVEKWSSEEVTEWLFKHIRQWYEEGLGKKSVMEREGWRDLLETNVDLGQLNSPKVPYLGVAATDVATGASRMFWNRVPPPLQDEQGTTAGLTIEHIMASSSIPGIYEATRVDRRYWWDGALIANTPIAPAIDVGAKEIIVVLMTPWHEHAEGAGVPVKAKSPTVVDALERFLDWMMLAPLRSELRQLTTEQRRRIRIIAPPKLLGAVQIVDYGLQDSKKLIAQGEKDAAARLEQDPFPPG